MPEERPALSARLGRDTRPEIPPSRRRLTAADLYPEAAEAERRRLEAEQHRQRALQPARAGQHERQTEEEPELEEPILGVVQQVREAVRAHRGD